jgi:hypothetical protein
MKNLEIKTGKSPYGWTETKQENKKTKTEKKRSDGRTKN